MTLMRAIRSSYAGVGEVFQRYWRTYGGMRALLLSPYFHAAVLLTGLLTPYWIDNPWWQVALSVIPNLLGFTLAGFAIWLGFGSERLREMISRPGDDGSPSVYVQVSATFVHFVVIQAAALLAAAFAMATSAIAQPGAQLGEIIEQSAAIGHALGFLLFIYAIATALAAAMAVFRVSTWNDIVARDGQQEGASDSGGQNP